MEPGRVPHALSREPVLAFFRGCAYIDTADSFAVLSCATDGTPLARTTMSGGLRMHAIGDDYVLGIAVHPTDGAQSVRLHTLRRGS